MLDLDTIGTDRWIISSKNGQKRVITSELAEHIKKDLHYYFVKSGGSDKPFVYVYWNGVYKNMPENEFKAIIKKYIPYDLVKMREIDEVYRNLQADFRGVDHELFNMDENVINFEDGILDLKTMELKPHTPELLSTIQIPSKYEDIKNSPATAPIFNKYMMRLLDNDLEKYDIMMQYLGLCISNIYGYRTKKALFLVGEGNTGKSQIKKIVEKILGNGNISTTDLQQLNERFGTSSIYQKRLSGCNDMSYQRVTDMSTFKSITGGDQIMYEFKGRTPFFGTHKGVLWFNCNKLPLFGGDKGDWVYERILPIYCGKTIPESERDPFLFEKIWEEKDTIIRIALFYLKKLVDNKFKFKIPKDSYLKLDDYKVRNNTLLTFIDECCEVDLEGFHIKRTTKGDFKNIYYKWCDVNNSGKGKLKLKEIEEIIETRYNEKYGIYNGYKVLNNIRVKREEREDLGFYEKDLWR